MPLHKVGYRLAEYTGGDAVYSIEQILRIILDEHHAADYTDRIFSVSDRRTRAFINRNDTAVPGVLAEIFQLDPRRALSFVLRAPNPSPTADVRTRDVPEGEDHIGLPAYMLVYGNHIALIESLGLRTLQIESYLNSLFLSSGLLEAGCFWKLSPRIEIVDAEEPLDRNLTSFAIQPIARMIGDGPSQAKRRPARRSGRNAAVREEKVARAPRYSKYLNF